MELSSDAFDSYHRFREDMELMADNGLSAYRFGIDWSRIEPRPGQFSRAELAHYRRMIDTALELGLTPVITLHHFTAPAWFADEGGRFGDRPIEPFAAYATDKLAPPLSAGRVANSRTPASLHARMPPDLPTLRPRLLRSWRKA
ncbi:family 1 glycosylhydrolase [Microbacterium sp. A94]|uniref:family 1 glycosylhydrolase n=1 Tax=Microbacterium sp. A94 TaxID=3450717 RepID=UPI003F4451AB